MINKKLFELLKLVDGVNYSSWRIVNLIVDCIKENKSIVMKKKWSDSFKKDNPDWYPLDLSNINTWSTNDNGVSIVFENINNKLYCKVKIFECDNFEGYRKDLRFTAELILPNNFIKELSMTIGYYFDSYLEKSYEDHLENQKKLFIYNLRNKILNKK